MIIYPAIDMLGGRCVRLRQGNYSDSTVYGENPADVAKQWESAGARFIHLVDLDGAKAGKPVNLSAVQAIADTVSVPLQLGGGVRSMENLEQLFAAGVTRAILGTSAVENFEFLKQAVAKYGDRIAVGIDAKDGFVAVRGWESVSSCTAQELAKRVESEGVRTVIYTDIATDGMLTGPNLAAMEAMASSVRMDVIASGGVGRIEDVEALNSTGVAGVIIGRALYTGNVDLGQALEIGGKQS